jgi:hypothetical protein
MLKNLFKRNSLASLLVALSNSEFEFYLTGSQFFGNYTNESDYDFFVDNNHKTLLFLSQLGFNEVVSNHDYDFNNLCELWERTTVEGIKIQVQVLRCGCSEKKQIAQHRIYSVRDIFNVLDKKQRSKFWNMFL